MSWREIIGVTSSTKAPYTHNSQNAQKTSEPGSPAPLPAGLGMHPVPGDNCADIADSAYKNSEQQSSKLLESLADACRGLDITPTEVKEALAPEDIEEWHAGTISVETMATFAHSLVQRREMKQGKRPNHYTEQAYCQHCGPIWSWFSGEVLGCPWCWNRTADKPIPRPCSVRCSDCIHFERIDHPHLGHCAKGEPEAISGLWNTDRRYCERFLPSPQQANNN